MIDRLATNEVRYETSRPAEGLAARPAVSDAHEVDIAAAGELVRVHVHVEPGDSDVDSVALKWVS